MSGSTVLLVDDEAQIRKLISAFFERRGYSVRCAADGLEALRLVQDELPDILITDANMPNLNGFELTARLRANRRTARLPIVMLSALRREDDVLRGYTAGADEYVSKPIELSILLAKAETLLRRARDRAGVPADTAVAAVIAFVRAAGGVGTTTLAVNAATSLAKNGHRVSLIDLSLYGPSVATLLDLRPRDTLADIAGLTSTAIDADVVDSLIATHAGSGLRVISASARPEQAELVRVSAVNGVLDGLRTSSDFIVADLPPSFAEINLAAIDAAQALCILTTPRVAVLRATKDALDVLAKLGIEDDRIVLCLNRTAPGGVGADQVASFFGRAADCVIPYGQAIADAGELGKAIVLMRPDSSDAAGMQTLARKLAEVATAVGQVAPRGRPAAA
ncbi:MAG: two-component system, cell cycle response regulator [Chloroflexota bacterium]|jgi:DNA-binding response OmpR family regulator|nr:two-component system, cell cycle response regulator [Chloroflexota bacterium]